LSKPLGDLQAGFGDEVPVLVDRTGNAHHLARLVGKMTKCEGIAESMFHWRSREFLEADKRRLAGDTARQATSGEVKALYSTFS